MRNSPELRRRLLTWQMYVAQQYHKTATYKQKRSLAIASDLGAPEGTRTPDLLIRSQTGHLHLNTLPYKI